MIPEDEMNESNDLRSGILAAIDAYKRRYEPKPLGPLVVPDWYPAAVLAEGKTLDWIEETARAIGFDGWETVSESYDRWLAAQ